jgi:hypothetical protein
MGTSSCAPKLKSELHTHIAFDRINNPIPTACGMYGINRESRNVIQVRSYHQHALNRALQAGGGKVRQIVQGSAHR